MPYHPRVCIVTTGKAKQYVRPVQIFFDQLRAISARQIRSIRHISTAKMALLPPDEHHQKAIEQLYFYKDPKKTEEDVDALIEWLSKQPHLPNITG